MLPPAEMQLSGYRSVREAFTVADQAVRTVPPMARLEHGSAKP